MTHFTFSNADRTYIENLLIQEELTNKLAVDCINRLENACDSILEQEARSLRDKQAGFSTRIKTSRDHIEQFTGKIEELLEIWSCADILTRQEIEEVIARIAPEMQAAGVSVFSMLQRLQDDLKDRLSQMPVKTPRASPAKHLFLINLVTKQYGIKPSRNEASPFVGIVETCFRAMALTNDQGEPASVQNAIRSFMEDTPRPKP